MSFIEGRYSKNASYVITVGRYLATELAKESFWKIKVLYNSPVINESPYKLRRDLKVTNNKKILLYVDDCNRKSHEGYHQILPTLPSEIVFATVNQAILNNTN